MNYVWQDNVTKLANNITVAVRKAKAQGTVGMSRANLRQIVSTSGVSGLLSPNAFERLFDEAVAKAKLPAGFLY
jgi:hypothetical protein